MRATKVILYSYDVVDAARAKPKAQIPIAAAVKSTVPATVIESTIYFKNQGPAIARPLDATIKPHEL